MLLATEGTILSALSAKTLKWSINLSGGYHHASFERGGGFCIYPDISLAIYYLKSRLGYRKIMIIDLDAHQGNGHERDHFTRDDIYIVDAYNHQIYPRDKSAKKSISRDIDVNANTTDEEYLDLISSIEQDIDSFAP
jgi:histone deacetylase 11